MPHLVPSAHTDQLPSVGVGLSALAATDRRSRSAMSSLQRRTLVRLASVQAHASVQVQKAHELDHLSREAMSGQAMLSQWGAALAQGDAFLADDLKFFADLAKMGKGEIIADTVSDFCQEGRR